MRCLIAHCGSGYEPADIELLATLLHPMAAVAWDRDCADVELTQPAEHECFSHPNTDRVLPLAALRFSISSDLSCNARTGTIGMTIARWDHDGARWVRT